MKILIAVLLLTAGFSVSAADKVSCDNAMEAIPAYDSSKKMFNEIFQFKQKYSHCMDGSIAEGIESVVVESLDKSWKQLPDIEKLNKQDSTFKKFIIDNIAPNVTAQEKEVKSIIARSKKSCPNSMAKFCKDLTRSCENSLKED